MRPRDPRVTIVVPVRNEARNLEVVLPQLPQTHQVILVDGHSVDDSVEVATRLLPDIEVVTQTRIGKGNALACGFAVATGDVIVMFDADGSADPAEISVFVKALTAGADFAKGTRFAKEGGSDDITAIRRLGNGMLNLITNRLMGTRFTDLCYGYNAFWRDMLEVIALPSTNLPVGSRRQWGDGFEVETLINCRIASSGSLITEVPSFERDRLYGESNLSTFRDGTRVLRVIFSEYARDRRTRGRLPRQRSHSPELEPDRAVNLG